MNFYVTRYTGFTNMNAIPEIHDVLVEVYNLNVLVLSPEAKEKEKKNRNTIHQIEY